MLEKDTAVCLRTVNYSDTSQVVTLFTRERGKVGAIAKGSRRAKSSFGGAIEVFSFGDIVFAPSASGKLATLTEFEQRADFLGLRRKLFNLNCGLFAAELLEAFTQDHDPHADLFDCFVRFLSDCQGAGDDIEAIGFLILFQLSLLAGIGTKPVLERCVNCQAVFGDNWRQAYFSSIANGLICQDCEQAFTDKIRLSRGCAGCLADMKLFTSADERTLREVEKVLIYHFTALMHRSPKTAKYFL